MCKRAQNYINMYKIISGVILEICCYQNKVSHCQYNLYDSQKQWQV